MLYGKMTGKMEEVQSAMLSNDKRKNQIKVLLCLGKLKQEEVLTRKSTMFKGKLTQIHGQ